MNISQGCVDEKRRCFFCFFSSCRLRNLNIRQGLALSLSPGFTERDGCSRRGEDSTSLSNSKIRHLLLARFFRELCYRRNDSSCRWQESEARFVAGMEVKESVWWCPAGRRNEEESHVSLPERCTIRFSGRESSKAGAMGHSFGVPAVGA